MPRKKAPEVEWTGQVVIPGSGCKKARVESESSVIDRSLKALEMAGGVHVMRNNVGAIKKGQRYIKYGLAKGSADYVAIVAPHGRWLCLEFKRGDGGDPTPEQETWLALMREHGAVADFVTSPERALELLALARIRPC